MVELTKAELKAKLAELEKEESPTVLKTEIEELKADNTKLQALLDEGSTETCVKHGRVACKQEVCK